MLGRTSSVPRITLTPRRKLSSKGRKYSLATSGAAGVSNTNPAKARISPIASIHAPPPAAARRRVPHGVARTPVGPADRTPPTNPAKAASARGHSTAETYEGCTAGNSPEVVAWRTDAASHLRAAGLVGDGPAGEGEKPQGHQRPCEQRHGHRHGARQAAEEVSPQPEPHVVERVEHQAAEAGRGQHRRPALVFGGIQEEGQSLCDRPEDEDGRDRSHDGLPPTCARGSEGEGRTRWPSS